MKKLIATTVALAMAWGVSASTLTWGQFGAVEDWNGNDGADTSYALIYVLQDASSVPTFNADAGTWNLNGATYLATAAYDANEGQWGDPVGTNYGAVDSGDDGADQQYFAIFMTSENVSNIADLVGEGKYYALIGPMQGEQFSTPIAGGVEFYTDVSSFDDVSKSAWNHARAVPEPTSVALLALGLAAFGLKRKVA